MMRRRLAVGLGFYAVVALWFALAFWLAPALAEWAFWHVPAGGR